MDHQVKWVADLEAPKDACERKHAGVPLIVTADDITRAAAELRKGLHEVVFNTIQVSAANGSTHFVLGSVA